MATSPTGTAASFPRDPSSLDPVRPVPEAGRRAVSLDDAQKSVSVFSDQVRLCTDGWAAPCAYAHLVADAGAAFCRDGPTPM